MPLKVTRKEKSKEAEAKLKSRRAAKVEAKQPKERLEAASLGAFRRSIKQLLCHPPIVLGKPNDSGRLVIVPLSPPAAQTGLTWLRCHGRRRALKSLQTPPTSTANRAPFYARIFHYRFQKPVLCTRPLRTRSSAG